MIGLRGQHRHPVRLVASLLGLMLLAAACGGGHASAGPSAATQIQNTWTAFFSSKTTVAQKVALLQDGSKFATFIAAEVKNPLAAGLSASVSKVAVHGSTATVTWSVQVGTQKLSPGPGQAVLVAGKWLISEATFCNLAQLEGKPPAGCP